MIDLLESKHSVYVLLLMLLLMPQLNIEAQTLEGDSLTLKTVELNWKLAPGDTLKYQTVMMEIESSDFEVDFGGMFDQFLDDSTQVEQNGFAKDFFEEIREIHNNIDFVTVITNSENFADVLEVELIGLPKEEKEQSFMASMMQGVMLKGSVYKTGGLHSFWVKSSQKNLLSALFELPEKTLVEGEHWSLPHVNFIANDQNFTCYEAAQHNEVILRSIRQQAGDTIATIEYDIRESVVGEFKTPSFLGGQKVDQVTSMQFVLKAQAEFSVTQGKWLSYDAILSMDGTGFMKAKQRQKIALMEAKD